jgi:hypothetical protein
MIARRLSWKNSQRQRAGAAVEKTFKTIFPRRICNFTAKAFSTPRSFVNRV